MFTQFILYSRLIIVLRLELDREIYTRFRDKFIFANLRGAIIGDMRLFE